MDPPTPGHDGCNKVDLPAVAECCRVKKGAPRVRIIPVSARTGLGLDEVKRFIRVVSESCGRRVQGTYRINRQGQQTGVLQLQPNIAESLLQLGICSQVASIVQAVILTPPSS